MFKRRFSHRIPGLNTTSTADISFMLLIFFLVTTSIDNDYGLPRRLSPPPQEDTEETVVKQRDMLTVTLGEGDRLTCDGRETTPEELEVRIEEFIENKSDSPDLPEKHRIDIPLLGKCDVTNRHVIILEVDRQATYDAYFGLQATIVATYSRLRDRLARRRFGLPYKECTPEQQNAIAAYYPQRISENVAGDEGGGQ